MEVAVRIVNELRPTSSTAKMMGNPVQFMVMSGRRRVDRHPANRVYD
jgi:hypothetical protein